MPNTVTVDLSGPLFQYGGTEIANRIIRFWLEYMADTLRAKALPKMIDATPRRTGNLRRQLKLTLRQHERAVIIYWTRSGFYGVFIPGLEERLERIFEDVVNANVQPALNFAIAKALA